MPLTTSAAARQLSDGNSQGTILGQSTTDLIGFHGATPTAQRSGNAQAAITRGQQAGCICTYNTTQSPSAVTANTTAEKSMTVQSGSGSTMLLATGDLCYINKPTSQAGLGMGNIRVSASNTAQVTFQNATGSSITPTGSEVYQIVALRGLPNLSVTLSPAAVPANTTMEQQFAVTGLPAGSLVQVSKPTAQAGLDIVGCRVVSSNVLGITFCNVTGSAITPTAAESYTVLSLFGLDALSNEINYAFNVGSVGAIGAGIVITGGSTTLTGLLATDAVLGIFKPTAQAAATNAAFPIMGIPTANTLTLYFAGIGTGATPTGSEVYQIRTMRQQPAAPLLNYSQALAPVSVAANTTAEQTFTVTGLVAGSPVWINKPSLTQGIGIAGVRVSAASTLAVTYINTTANAITPPTETYQIGNFQVAGPGAANAVYQLTLPVANAIGVLANEMRAALVAKGLIAGA